MRIEDLSIKSVTIITLSMVGVIAIVLSIIAGSYFKQAALDAQIKSLSRVIEVATQEVFKEVNRYTFNLGMSLSNNEELLDVLAGGADSEQQQELARFLDDPFINGFVGAGNISLEKIRIYDLDLNLIAESNVGLKDIEAKLTANLLERAQNRKGIERLKTIDALWISKFGPLHSTLVPVGGLRQQGYLEIIINPDFNLPDIGKITKTPVSIFSTTGIQIKVNEQSSIKGYLPVEYTLLTTDGQPAFRIIGYEDVDELNREMNRTQLVATSGFLLLTLVSLMAATWAFSRFLFVPVRNMVMDIKQMANGKLDLKVDKRGLKEFRILAEAFNSMANQIKSRTNELEEMSMQDSLTGIANRRKFYQDYKRELQRAVRHKGYFSMLLIDVDYFKKYNDTYGHRAGDDCLRKISLALHHIINRPDDLVARYGGEEFAAILPDTPVQGLKQVAERFKQAVEDMRIPHSSSEISDIITISIGGISIIPDTRLKSADIIQAADEALYKAKQAGRNSIVIADTI